MKKILFLSLFAPTICFAQKYAALIQDGKFLGVMPAVNESIFYSGVVNVDSASKVDLYNRGKRFFVDSYKSAKDVIQLDDKENGEIDGKGFFKTSWEFSGFAGPTNVSIYETVKLFVKDGKYKYEISNFTIAVEGQNPMSLEAFLADRPANKKKFIPNADNGVVTLIEALKIYMNKKIVSDF